MLQFLHNLCLCRVLYIWWGISNVNILSYWWYHVSIGIVNGEHPELSNQYPGYQGAAKSLGTSELMSLFSLFFLLNILWNNVFCFVLIFHTQKFFLFSTVASPAQGSLAENSFYNDSQNHTDVSSAYHKKKLKNSEPIVLLEQLTVSALFCTFIMNAFVHLQVNYNEGFHEVYVILLAQKHSCSTSINHDINNLTSFYTIL